MKVTINVKKEFEAKYLAVSANVRYWDDARINGETSEDGELVPFKQGDMWIPVIDIDTGEITDWPKGTVGDFHFKVCDAGEYTLFTEQFEKIVSIDGYVPNGLCHGDQGYGDYIIFKVNKDGFIEGYKNDIDLDDWIVED